MVSVSDYVVSFIDGRVRLRHPALKNREQAELATAFISGVDGVTEARANPMTGSLLVFYDAEKLSREKLLDMARQGAALLPDDEQVQQVHDGKSPAACCARVLLGRNATRLVDKALLVSLAASLVGAITGMGTVHRVTGAVFALASIQHMAAHRKALW